VVQLIVVEIHPLISDTVGIALVVVLAVVVVVGGGGGGDGVVVSLVVCGLPSLSVCLCP